MAALLPSPTSEGKQCSHTAAVSTASHTASRFLLIESDNHWGWRRALRSNPTQPTDHIPQTPLFWNTTPWAACVNASLLIQRINLSQNPNYNPNASFPNIQLIQWIRHQNSRQPWGTTQGAITHPADTNQGYSFYLWVDLKVNILPWNCSSSKQTQWGHETAGKKSCLEYSRNSNIKIKNGKCKQTRGEYLPWNCTELRQPLTAASRLTEGLLSSPGNSCSRDMK